MSQFGKQFSAKSKTKSSGNGKRKIKSRDKRRSESGNYFSATRVGKENEIRPFMTGTLELLASSSMFLWLYSLATMKSQ